MLLKQLLDSLIYGELANLSIGKPEWNDGTFNYKRLIECISLGNIELHKRFTLKKENVVLQIDSSIDTYTLDYTHAISNTTSTDIKYIIDSASRPFSGNVGRIDSVYDHKGRKLYANTTQFTQDIKFLDYKTILMSNLECYSILNLVCRAIPTPINLQSENDLDSYEIDLPYQYIESLLLYAAGRATANRGAENSTNNESAIFFARFEASCANIITLGLDTTEEMYNEKLLNRGFV